MRGLALILAGAIAVSACTPMISSPLRTVITTQDMLINRPGTDMEEALFRLQADGTGTVDFIAGPDGPQSVTWTLAGNRFCITSASGLMASFDCAILTITGPNVAFEHTQSDKVATGQLVAR